MTSMPCRGRSQSKPGLAGGTHRLAGRGRYVWVVCTGPSRGFGRSPRGDCSQGTLVGCVPPCPVSGEGRGVRGRKGGWPIEVSSLANFGGRRRRGDTRSWVAGNSRGQRKRLVSGWRFQVCLGPPRRSGGVAGNPPLGLAGLDVSLGLDIGGNFVLGRGLGWAQCPQRAAKRACAPVGGECSPCFGVGAVCKILRWRRCGGLASCSRVCVAFLVDTRPFWGVLHPPKAVLPVSGGTGVLLGRLGAFGDNRKAFLV